MCFLSQLNEHFITTTMPFKADIRGGTFQLSLNVYVIHEEVERIAEKEFVIDDNFEEYVRRMENDYSSYMDVNLKCIPFWDWFVDNYNNNGFWDKLNYYYPTIS